jgi:hypothetical protein
MRPPDQLIHDKIHKQKLSHQRKRLPIELKDAYIRFIKEVKKETGTYSSVYGRCIIIFFFVATAKLLILTTL